MLRPKFAFISQLALAGVLPLHVRAQVLGTRLVHAPTPENVTYQYRDSSTGGWVTFDYSKYDPWNVEDIDQSGFRLADDDDSAIIIRFNQSNDAISDFVVTNCQEFCDDGDITLLLDTSVLLHFPDTVSHNTSNTPQNDTAWYNTHYIPLEWHSTFYASNSCGGGIQFNITTIDAHGEELHHSGWDYGSDTGFLAPIPEALPAPVLLYSNTGLGGGNFTFFDNMPRSTARGPEPAAGQHKRAVTTAGLHARAIYCID